jgi:hypothetical protein
MHNRQCSGHDTARAGGGRKAVADRSWAILVRKSAVAVDGVEGSAQVVGERIGGRDHLLPDLDLNDAVAAGRLDA